MFYSKLKNYLIFIPLLLICNNVHAEFEKFPEINSLVQVPDIIDITGSISAQSSNGQVMIKVERIKNVRANYTTGTLGIALRMTEQQTPYGYGYTVARENLATIPFNNGSPNNGILSSGQSFTNLQTTVPFSTPPNGTYYVHITVVNLVSPTTIIGFATFNSTTTIGSTPPPPPPPPPTNQDIHGNTANTATTITSFTDYDATLNSNEDLDFFKFTITEESDVSIVSNGTIVDPIGTLYDNQENIIGSNDDVEPDGCLSALANTGDLSDCNFTIGETLAAGTYYLEVKRSGGGLGDYSIKFGTSNTQPPNNQDTIGPVITIQGDNPIIIDQGSIYFDAGATAVDNIDGTVFATLEENIDTSIVGENTVTWSATDLDGNTTTAERTVIVRAQPTENDDSGGGSLDIQSLIYILIGLMFIHVFRRKHFK